MRKMDEMELAITLQAIRWTFLFTLLVELVWGIWNFVQVREVTAPIYLIIYQNLFLFCAMQIGKWRSGDTDGRKTLLLMLVMTVVFIVLFGALILFCAE